MSQSQAFRVMLGLLKADNNYIKLEEWAEQYGVALPDGRFSEKWRYAVSRAIGFAEEEK